MNWRGPHPSGASLGRRWQRFDEADAPPDADPLDRLSVREGSGVGNDLRTRCQCCGQGKDAARTEPRCCAKGECCRQVAKEWTVRQAWAILRSALSAAQREELVT